MWNFFLKHWSKFFHMHSFGKVTTYLKPKWLIPQQNKSWIWRHNRSTKIILYYVILNYIILYCLAHNLWLFCWLMWNALKFVCVPASKASWLKWAEQEHLFGPTLGPIPKALSPEPSWMAGAKWVWEAAAWNSNRLIHMYTKINIYSVFSGKKFHKRLLLFLLKRLM